MDNCVGAEVGKEESRDNVEEKAAVSRNGTANNKRRTAQPQLNGEKETHVISKLYLYEFVRAYNNIKHASADCGLFNGTHVYDRILVKN